MADFKDYVEGMYNHITSYNDTTNGWTVNDSLYSSYIAKPTPEEMLTRQMVDAARGKSPAEINEMMQGVIAAAQARIATEAAWQAKEAEENRMRAEARFADPNWNLDVVRDELCKFKIKTATFKLPKPESREFFSWTSAETGPLKIKVTVTRDVNGVLKVKYEFFKMPSHYNVKQAFCSTIAAKLDGKEKNDYLKIDVSKEMRAAKYASNILELKTIQENISCLLLLKQTLEEQLEKAWQTLNTDLIPAFKEAELALNNAKTNIDEFSIKQDRALSNKRIAITESLAEGYVS